MRLRIVGKNMKQNLNEDIRNGRINIKLFPIYKMLSWDLLFFYSIIFLSMGPFLFGFNTTLLSRQLHKITTNCTGNIMAWDTIGSVFGSIATTLLLMPFIGVNYTVVLITILSIIAAIILRPKWWVYCICAITIFISVFLNSNWYQNKKFGIVVNNANSTISVEEIEDIKILNMNGLPMSIYNNKNGDTAEYVRYLNNHFIYNMPNDKTHKILVLGAGGFTLGIKDEHNEYTFVDIERTLKDVSEKKKLI